MQIDDENSSSIDNLEKIAPKQKLAKKKVIPDDDEKSTTNTSFQLPLPKGLKHVKAKENNSKDKKNPVKSSSNDADNQKKVERKDNNVDLVKSSINNPTQAKFQTPKKQKLRQIKNSKSEPPKKKGTGNTKKKSLEKNNIQKIIAEGKLVTTENNKMEIDSNVEDDKVPTEAKLKIKPAVVNSHLKNENKQEQTPTKKMEYLKKKKTTEKLRQTDKTRETEKLKEPKSGGGDDVDDDNIENNFERKNNDKGNFEGEEDEEKMPKIEGKSRSGRLRKKSSRYSY